MTLIDRLSKLDGPDRDYDREMMSVLMPEDFACGTFPPQFTASVDAAIALAERELPGANVLIGWGQTKETKPWARIGVIPSHDATGFNLATALCIAILRAKETSNAE